MRFTARRRLAISVAVIGLIGAVTLGIGFKTKSQQLKPSGSPGPDLLSQQIEKSADHPLRILENDDSPVRILDANVKEVSGSDFTRYTGRPTNLITVCTLPQIRVLNSSSKPITSFVLAIRDPASKTTRGVVKSKISLDQGEIYTITPQDFIEPELTSAVSQDGKIQSRYVRPGIQSEKYWLSFASRSSIFVTVARVSFQDGSVWRIKEGGEIQ
jgi:hypothetical protein